MVEPLIYSTCISDTVHCSLIGLVPKGWNTRRRWRMNVDLSFPHGSSVNSRIQVDLASFKYCSVDDATQYIRALGQGTLLIKDDLKSVYCIVPIHPADRHLLGIRWNGQVYMDQPLPYGLRSTPKLFTAVTDAIGWALTEFGVTMQIHYLDDFLCFVLLNTGASSHILPHIHSVLDCLGVPVVFSKVEGPSTAVIVWKWRLSTSPKTSL